MLIRPEGKFGVGFVCPTELLQSFVELLLLELIKGLAQQPGLSFGIRAIGHVHPHKIVDRIGADLNI